MKEGLRFRVFLTGVLLVWLLPLFCLFGVAGGAGETYVHMTSDQGHKLPMFTTDFSLAVMWHWGRSLTSVGVFFGVWGMAFGMPLLAILLTWLLKDIHRVRWWFLFLAVCDVYWILVMGILTAVGAWFPFTPL